MKLSFVMPVLALGKDLGWELLATTTGPELPRTCVDAPELPATLRGRYFVGGPAEFELGEYELQCLFDGYGKLNKFEIGGGQVCYTGKVMNTNQRSVSKERNYPAGLQFESTTPERPVCDLIHPMCEMSVNADNNWVNTIQVAGELLWLTDSFLMLDFDSDTMDIKGIKPWSDDKKSLTGSPVPTWVDSMHVGTSGSAHPLLRPNHREYIDILAEMGPVPGEKSFLNLFSFGADVKGPQDRKLLVQLPFDKVPYMHSFGLTENYAVLPVNLGMDSPKFANPVLLGLIQDHWQGVYVVNLETLEVKEFQPKPFAYVHVANSFENATGVTMDLGAVPSNPFVKSSALDLALFKNKTARDSEYVENCVRRFHFHMSGPLAGEVTEENLYCGAPVDFFRVHPDFAGKDYCIYYATQWFSDNVTRSNMAIMKHDICKGQMTMWQKENVYPGEANLMPTGTGEEDGVVGFLALNGNKGVSELVMLDAKDMSEIKVVELPEHIPFTAHGQFIKATDELVV